MATTARNIFPNLLLPSAVPRVQRTLAFPYQAFRNRGFRSGERIRPDIGAGLRGLMRRDCFADLMRLPHPGRIDGIISSATGVSRIRAGVFGHVAAPVLGNGLA